MNVAEKRLEVASIARQMCFAGFVCNADDVLSILRNGTYENEFLASRVLREAERRGIDPYDFEGRG